MLPELLAKTTSSNRIAIDCSLQPLQSSTMLNRSPLSRNKELSIVITDEYDESLSATKSSW